MSNNIDLFYDMAIKRIESLENPSEFEIENELLDSPPPAESPVAKFFLFSSESKLPLPS